jgi:hypothetical protein
MIYDNLTDAELLRAADTFHREALVKALTERLEMRLRDIDELEHLLGRKAPQPMPNINQLELDI